MKEFRIRASSIGDIMTGTIGLTEVQQNKLNELQAKKAIKPLTAIQEGELNRLLEKEKNPDYPVGLKTFCEVWLKQKLYKRKKEFTSKYTEKGDAVEQESLIKIKDHLGLASISKNDEYLENQYIHGTPDVNESLLIDAKNSWDCFTFPLFETELPEDKYYWQGQGYMALTGKDECHFAYVLCDTPEHLIRNEAKSFCYRSGYEMSPDIMEDFKNKMTYSDISDELKIKVFTVKRNDSDIQKIYERVKCCRTYLGYLTSRNKSFNTTTAT